MPRASSLCSRVGLHGIRRYLPAYSVRGFSGFDSACGRPWKLQSSRIQGSKTTLNDVMMPVSRTAALFSIPFNFISISIRGRRIVSDGGRPTNGVFAFEARKAGIFISVEGESAL